MDLVIAELWALAIRSDNRDSFVQQSGAAPDFTVGIWNAAHMSPRELVESSKLTQAEFARRYCLSVNTVKSWCQGIRRPTESLFLLLACDLGLIPQKGDGST